jgi:serine/threonine-protein kinase
MQAWIGKNLTLRGSTDVNFRERMYWVFRMSLLAFVLASVMFLSALTAMRFAIQGREVAMPDLVGMKSSQAQSVLQGRKLGMRVEDHTFSELPVDSVVRQSPLPNTRVKTGQDAHVVLSSGPQNATIPQLENTSLRAARIELLRSGLQAGEVSSAHLSDEPADTVIVQNPGPGVTSNIGPRVDMFVSLGPSPAAYVMPALSGLSLVESESRLRAAGLKIGKITPVVTPNIPAGTIVGQSPPRGQRVDANSTIELQVAE